MHSHQRPVRAVLAKSLAALASAACAMTTGLFCAQPSLAQEMDSATAKASTSAMPSPIDSNTDTQSAAALIAQAAAREQRNAGIDTYSAFPDGWQMASGMPSEGDAHVLVLRVDFPDMHFDADDTAEALQNDIDGSAGTAPFESFSAFYERSSYGKLHIDGKVYDYTASQPRDSYTGNTRELFYEAMHALDDRIDFSQFDGNDDGKIDAVYLHFAGPNTGWGTSWWANESIADSPEHADERFDGKQLWNTILFGGNATNAASMVPTLCHETGHALGLPDYYSYMHSSDKGGTGTFAMMEANDADFTGFSKWLLGWVDDGLITRAVVDGNGVTWKKGLADTEHHAATLDVTLSALSTDEMKDHGGFSVISNDKTLLTPSGIFSSYYLVQYDAVAGAQTCGNAASMAPGFRVFRIQAGLDNGNNAFEHSNTYGRQTDQLIESVTGPVGRSNPFFVAGDHLSPTTTPSTNFHENTVHGSTGIDLTVLDNRTASGSIRIGYAAKQAVDFTISDDVMPGKLANMGEYRLSTSIVPQIASDPAKAKLTVDGKSYDMNVRVDGGKRQLVVDVSVNAGTISPKSHCEFVFPAGTFVIDTDQDGNPVYSQDIHVPIQPSLLAKVEFSGDVDLPDGTNSSNVVTLGGNGSYYVTVSDGSVVIHKVSTSNYSQSDAIPVSNVSTDRNDTVTPRVGVYDADHIFIVLVAHWADQEFLIVNTDDGSVTARSTAPLAMTSNGTDVHYRRIGGSILVQEKIPTSSSAALYMQTLVTPQSDGTFSMRRTTQQYSPLQTTSDGQVYIVKNQAAEGRDVLFFDGTAVERRLIEVGTPVDEQTGTTTIDDSLFDALSPTNTLHLKDVYAVAAVDTNADTKDTRYAIYAQQWQTLPSGRLEFTWHIQTFDAKGNLTSDTVDSSNLITPNGSTAELNEALLRISPTGAVAVTRLNGTPVFGTLLLDSEHSKLSTLCDRSFDWGDWVDDRWMSIGTDIERTDATYTHYAVTSQLGNPSSPGTKDDPSAPTDADTPSKPTTPDAAGTHAPIVMARTGSTVMMRWTIALCLAAGMLILVAEYTRHAEG